MQKDREKYRELDAEIHRHLAREPVWWSTAYWHPDSGWKIQLGPRTLHTDVRGTISQQPVWVGPGRCICDLVDEHWPEEERVHGHYWNCLEVVPHYASEPGDTWRMILQLRERGTQVEIESWGDSKWHVVFFGGMGDMGTAIEESFEYAAVRAALNILKEK